MLGGATDADSWMATPTTVSSTPDATTGQKAIDGQGPQTGMASPSTVSSTPPLGQRPGLKKQATMAAEEEVQASGTRNSYGKKNATEVKGRPPAASKIGNMFRWSRDRAPDQDTRSRDRRVFRQEGKFGSKRKHTNYVGQFSSIAAAPEAYVGASRREQSIRPRSKEAWAAEGANQTARSDTVGGATSGTSRSSRAYRGAFENERCSRCTREAVWTACDVFWTFDPDWFMWANANPEQGRVQVSQMEHPKEITRDGYIASLSVAPTVDRLRMLRRSGLEQRFRKSAHPVGLQEFLRMIWPAAQEQHKIPTMRGAQRRKEDERDMQLMERWAKLREAWSIVHNKNFRSTDNEMNRIYNLCAENGEDEVPIGEFVRAQLLRADDGQKLFRTPDLYHRLNKESDKSVLQNHFKVTYVTLDTQRKMKQEEEAMISNNWMGIVDKKAVQSS